MKNPENKKEWLIDEPAAEVVRKIFELCLAGFGPTQIARKLTDEKIPTPTEYWNSIDRKCSATPEVKGKWAQTCVADILERREYVGDTVNFRSTTKSFKNKTKVNIPEEDWVIFENTHPAIIDRETFELVKVLRKNKRRPTREGKVSMFSGLMFCKDCGSKMYFCTAKEFEHNQNWFTCALARKNKDACSGHFIREVQVEAAVLINMQRVFTFVHNYESRFAEMMLEQKSEDHKKELAAKRRELKRSQRRIEELNGWFKKTYEDNAKGKLTDEQYEMLSNDYTTEQAELRELVKRLEVEITEESKQSYDLDKFIAKVKKVTEIKELTPELVHEFISRIEVHKPYRENGIRYQQVDIYYHGVGIIRLATAEEMEASFQKHMENKKKINKKRHNCNGYTVI